MVATFLISLTVRISLIFEQVEKIAIPGLSEIPNAEFLDWDSSDEYDRVSRSDDR